jgi:hypothetical protein
VGGSGAGDAARRGRGAPGHGCGGAGSWAVLGRSPRQWGPPPSRARRGMAPAAGNGGLREECEPAGQNSAAREGGSRLVARWWGEEEEDKLARPGKSGDLYVSCFFSPFLHEE